MQNQKRELWLDIAKGLGIITVVIGHTENVMTPYIYWFHMPLFFILSGYVGKSIGNWSDFKKLVIKRTYQMLIPYASFLFLFVLASHSFFNIFKKLGHLDWIDYNLLQIIIGGRAIDGLYSVFWFITCLYATQLIFALITLIFKTKKKQILIIILFYIFSHIESQFTSLRNVPIIFNLDVSLLALAYYAFGFYSKELITGKYNNYIYIVSTPLVFIFVSLQVTGNMNYSLSMKSLHYFNLFLDFIIPILFSMLIIRISQTFSFLNPLANLGRESLAIMYLHIPILWISSAILNNILPLQFLSLKLPIIIVVSTIIPYFIVKFILQKIYILKFLFLGKSDPKPLLNPIPKEI